MQAWGGYAHSPFNVKKDVPLVVGGKKGGKTSNDFIDRPKLFHHIFDDIIKIPVKWIHVQRNPYDNISSFRKAKGDGAIDLYEKHNEGVKWILKNKECITIHLDDLCKNTKEVMRRLCDYYEIPIINKHLNHCRNVVWKKPKITRYNVKWWTEERIERVKKLISENNYMRGYSYEKKYNSIWW